MPGPLEKPLPCLLLKAAYLQCLSLQAKEHAKLQKAHAKSRERFFFLCQGETSDRETKGCTQRLAVCRRATRPSWLHCFAPGARPRSFCGPPTGLVTQAGKCRPPDNTAVMTLPLERVILATERKPEGGTGQLVICTGYRSNERRFIKGFQRALQTQDETSLKMQKFLTEGV